MHEQQARRQRADVTADGNDRDDDVIRFLRTYAGEMVDQLSEWVRIPSVAADPDRQLQMARSASWLAGEMRAIGLSTTTYPTGETQAVYAETLIDPSRPTVLVYSHHDVRHAKPEQWQETDPFTPILRDGRLFGRGASDAKGQVVAHLWALRAHLAATHRTAPAVNLKFLIEGEEESGSPHLRTLLEENAERFACDVIVFSDTLQWKAGTPAAVTSMRGMLSASLRVSGPARDVHSGAVSGVATNPLHVLVDVLSALHQPDGSISLPHFYDDVDEPSALRRRAIADVPFDEKLWQQRTETRSLTGEPGYTPQERLWLRPSLEILSLHAGDPEGIPRAVIPATAEATLNIRTVASQRVSTVAEQLRAFVAERMPDTVEYMLHLDEETGQEPYESPAGAATEAVKRALARGYEQAAVGEMGNAGGGPADLLSSRLGAPVIFIGTGLPEDHWHSSDESIHIDTMLAGAASIAYLWQELASAPVSSLG